MDVKKKVNKTVIKIFIKFNSAYSRKLLDAYAEIHTYTQRQIRTDMWEKSLIRYTRTKHVWFIFFVYFCSNIFSLQCPNLSCGVGFLCKRHILWSYVDKITVNHILRQVKIVVIWEAASWVFVLYSGSLEVAA